MTFPPLTLVIGGARSGESRLAEGLVPRPGASATTSRRPKSGMTGCATAWPKSGRPGGPLATWTTPLDVDLSLAAIHPGGAVLLDCATLWLTNHLLAGSYIAAKSASLIAALTTCASSVVVVSNEVGWGIVPDNALARAFRDHQGRINQAIASRADLVVGVMAGLPMVLKGQLPTG